MTQKTIRVSVTGAAGQIGYALLFRIASGEMFGKDTAVHLNLLELENALPALKGVCMELNDCAFPLLKSVTPTSDMREAFKDADWALLAGSVPRKAGMERKDLIKINAGIFVEQGRALNKNAKQGCKVLVIGNPCNTNAFIAKETARNLSAKNFFAMTMLDQNRAVYQLAKKANVTVADVSRLVIWGNHSATQYPDFENALIKGKPAAEIIQDRAWLETAFIETVQKRGAEIIKARGLSSAASAANAVIETVKNICTPTPKDAFFSTAISSDGSYGVPEGLVFSFPLRSNGTDVEIVQGISLSDFAKGKIAATTKELLQEKDAVKDIL